MKRRIYLFKLLVFGFLFQNTFAQTNWYLKTGSTDVGQLSSWTDDINGGVPTTTPTAFNTANTIWHIKNNAVATLTTNFHNIILATSKVQVESNCELVITGAGRISTCLLDANANATVTINNSRLYRPNSIAASSVFSLNASGAVLVGSGGNGAGPGAAFLGYGDVVVDASGPVLDGDCVVNGSLAITAGNTFGFDQYLLTLNGTIPVVSTGSLVGDASAILNVNGGNGGSIQFDAANGGDVLNQLNLNLLLPANELSISNSFTVLSILNIQQGYLKIDNINVTFSVTSDFILPAALSGGLTTAAGTTLTLLGDASGSNLIKMKNAADQIDLINVNTTVQTNPYGISSAANVATISVIQGSFAFGQTAASVVNNTLSTVNNGGALMFNGNTGVTNINTITVSGGTLSMSGTSVLNATLAECNSATGQLLSSNSPLLNVNTLSLTAGQTAFAGGTQTFTDAIVTDATLGINAGAISIATLTVNHANAQVNASPATITMDTVFVLLANTVNLSPSTSGTYKFISITDAPVTVGGAGSFSAIRVLANHANAQFNANSSTLSADTISALLANTINLSSATSGNYNLISITDAPVTVGGAGTFNVANKLVLNNNANALVTINGGAATLDSLFAFNGAIIHSNSNLNANKIRLDGGVSYTGNSSGVSAIGDFWIFDATVNNNNGTYTISDSLVTNHASAQIDFLGPTALTIPDCYISGGVFNITNSGVNVITNLNISSGISNFNGTSAVSVNDATVSGTSVLNVNNGQLNLVDNLFLNGGNCAVSGGSISLTGIMTFSSNGGYSNSGTGGLNLKATASKIAGIGNLTFGSFNGNANVTADALFHAGNTNWACLGTNGIQNISVVDWDVSTTGNGFPMACWGCAFTPNDVGGNFESICENDLSYTGKISTDLLVPGNAYWFYLGFTAPLTAGPSFTWFSKGDIVQGTLPLVNGVSNDFVNYLYGNPYPCHLDASQLPTGSYSVWDRNNNQQESWNGVASTPAGVLTNFIPPGQGFFHSNTSLTFQEIFKSTTISSQLNKNSSNTHLPWLRLKLKNNLSNDEALIMRSIESTVKKDLKYDVLKHFKKSQKYPNANLNVKQTTISSLDFDGLDYIMQSLPFNANNLTIPIRVCVKSTGTYTIEAFDFDQWDGCILLKDNVTLIEQDLTKGPYSFTINDTTNAPRFELSICASKQTGISFTDLNSPVQFYGHGLQTDVILNFNAPTNYKIIVSNILGQNIQHPIQGIDTQKRITIDVPLHELRFVRVEAEGRVYHQKCLGQ